MPEEKDTKNPVQSAARIFQVLELLAEKGEMGLMELSTALDLHKSTVHRLLMSLIYMGYARQDETTQKYMHLVQREGSNILYLYKIEAKVGTIRMASHVGMMQPMYCTGVGKAILSELPEEEVEKIWNESSLEKKTEKTITDLDTMKEVLAKVREDGYALDDEENETGVRCIAVSLRDYEKKTKYAFSISGPVSRMTEERMRELIPEMKNIQRGLQAELG